MYASSLQANNCRDSIAAMTAPADLVKDNTVVLQADVSPGDLTYGKSSTIISPYDLSFN